MLRSDVDNSSAPARRTVLAKIIREQAVGRQTELVAMLRKHGHIATQSSVSRDLRELGVAKLGDRYVLPETAVPARERFFDAQAVRQRAPDRRHESHGAEDHGRLGAKRGRGHRHRPMAGGHRHHLRRRHHIHRHRRRARAAQARRAPARPVRTLNPMTSTSMQGAEPILVGIFRRPRHLVLRALAQGHLPAAGDHRHRRHRRHRRGGRAIPWPSARRNSAPSNII